MSAPFNCIYTLLFASNDKKSSPACLVILLLQEAPFTDETVVVKQELHFQEADLLINMLVGHSLGLLQPFAYV